MKEIKLATRNSQLATHLGFTLAELVIVISIMGIFATMFLINFASLRGPRNLRIAQNELVTNFRRAQSAILSARDINTATAPRYYMIAVNQAGTSISYRAIGVTKNTPITQVYFDGSTGNQAPLETINLPTGVIVDSMRITDSAGTATAGVTCSVVGFAAPFATIYMDFRTGGTACNFSSIVPPIGSQATLDAAANRTLFITLRDVNSNTTNQVIVRGVTGVIETQ